MYGSNVYYSSAGQLFAYHESAFDQQQRSLIISREIQNFLGQSGYPCVAAIRALCEDSFRIGVYNCLGSNLSASAQLASDLLAFQKEQRESSSNYLTFWAMFPDLDFADEEQFESALWRELSQISQFDLPDAGWDPHFSSDPKDKKFCFSLGGQAYFVVGLMPHSSRRARRFFFPPSFLTSTSNLKRLIAKASLRPW